MASGAATAAMTVRALGGPTLLVELGGLRILTDPTFDGPRSYTSPSGAVLTKTAPAALSADGVGAVDVVLLSHDQHADNLDDGGRAFLPGAPVVLSTAAAAERLGGNVRALPSWESWTLDRPDGPALVVTAVPARHGPVGCEPLLGEVTGFVLTGDGLPTVYVSGDNAAPELVAEIAGRFAPVDIAVLFAGAARSGVLDNALLTLSSEQAATAARTLGARWVVPAHFNSWRHFTEDGAALSEAFAAAGLTDRLVLLEPGEEARIDGSSVQI